MEKIILLDPLSFEPREQLLEELQLQIHQRYGLLINQQMDLEEEGCNAGGWGGCILTPTICDLKDGIWHLSIGVLASVGGKTLMINRFIWRENISKWESDYRYDTIFNKFLELYNFNNNEIT